MIDLIKSLFTGDPSADQDPAADLQVAVLVLLLEAAHSDDDFDDEEEEQIKRAVKKHFGMDDDAMAALMQQAAREQKDSIDLYAFSRTIKAQYGADQRLAVLDMVWEIALADGHIDKHEEYLCRKLGDMFGVEHKDYIASRHRALRARAERS